MQWNLNGKRELVRNLTGMVGYVGSRGVHEPFKVDDADIVIPTLTPEGRWLFPNPVQSGTQINDQFGSIGRLTYEGNSYFHALEVGVQKAMSHGVQFQTSFTWGKSIDTGSAAGHGDQFSNSLSSLPYYDMRMLRTRSDFDIKRRLVVSLNWQVPSPKSLSGPAAWIANGWELGGIYKLSDGVPFTATWGTDADPQGMNSGDTWAFPDRLTTPGCATLTNPRNPNHYVKWECFAVPPAPFPTGTDATTCPFYNGSSNGIGCDPAPPLGPNGDPLPVPFPQCFTLRGRGSLNLFTAPGPSNLDFSVFKNHSIKKISESFNVQFRAEFFNILNHANFALPTTPDRTDIFDSTGTPTGIAGQLTKTTTPTS